MAESTVIETPKSSLKRKSGEDKTENKKKVKFSDTEEEEEPENKKKVEFSDTEEEEEPEKPKSTIMVYGSGIWIKEEDEDYPPWDKDPKAMKKYFDDESSDEDEESEDEYEDEEDYDEDEEEMLERRNQDGFWRFFGLDPDDLDDYHTGEEAPSVLADMGDAYQFFYKYSMNQILNDKELAEKDEDVAKVRKYGHEILGPLRYGAFQLSSSEYDPILETFFD